MEILTLIVKEEQFNKIVAGEIKEEIRSITPTSQPKYLKITPKEVTIKIYDAILFKAGHEDAAPSVLVKVINTELDYEPDSDGYIPLYEEDGKLIIEDAKMFYFLGDIIEKHNI